ncbi:hypothetical protein K2X89_13155, partial [Myxococcota bacterium]|nr:hypothetical protein [Myxococcota bacterium]
MQHRIAVLGASLVLIWTSAQSASAQVQVTTVPDVTLELGINQQVVDDGHSAIGRSQPSAIWVEPLAGLPVSAAIAAYDVLDDGIGRTRLVSFESDVLLPGPLVARRGDVVSVVGAGIFAMHLDVSTIGVPVGVITDALVSIGNELFLSFDGTVVLGGGVVAADEDLVRWNGAAFTLAFDGSAAGVDPALDLDAADRMDASWALSFDAGGVVAGIAFADEDVLAYSPSAAAWNPTPVFKGAFVDPDWIAGDVQAIAVPEPDTIVLLAAGGLTL